MIGTLINLVSDVAPMVASLFGGKLGSTVVEKVSTLLGVKNSPKSVLQALQNNPDLLIKLQEYEYNHKDILANMLIREKEMLINDVKHARDSHKDSIFPQSLTVMLLSFLVYLVYILSVGQMPDRFEDEFSMILTGIIASLSGIISYWFGSQRYALDKGVKK